MSAAAPDLAQHAAELRRNFDRAFSEAHRGDAAATEDLLAIEIGGDPYALRLSEISGLHAQLAVAPLPGPARELVGLTHLRGALVPVWDLRRLLAYPEGGTPRWLVLSASQPAVAFRFDRFERHVRVARDAIRPADASATSRLPVSHVVAVDGVVRPVLHLAAAIRDLTARAAARTPPSEPQS